MPANEIATPVQHTSKFQQRFGHLVSGWTIRLLVAFLISWVIVLIFFVSGAVSH